MGTGHGHAEARTAGRPGRWRRVRHTLGHWLSPHTHGHADSLDAAVEGSAEGMRAVWIGLAGLGATFLAQLAVVAASGSVALAADTVHNLADALTAVPLGIAFLTARRPADRRYTYGYGRAEDLAGVFVVLAIAASAAWAAFEAVRRLAEPAEVHHLGWVAAAGLVGFLGNEAVALYRVRVGRRIGSAALVADGLHARVDGLTSLAVVAGAGGVALGLPLADPVAALAICVLILGVLRSAALQVYWRLMDAVEPERTDAARAAALTAPGVAGLAELRLRWIGNRLRAEAVVLADPALSLPAADELAERVRRALIGSVPRLADAMVRVSPAGAGSAVERGDGGGEVGLDRRAPQLE
ncbi:cation diffusion facilitator family transporter [Allonocardiopsis opalescens]|nr:cation diffusion facilitator family transporter [Allonocardiopsis opalescens]